MDEFFNSNVKDVRKSQTNLDYNFDDKFLDFLNDLKRDLKTLGVKDVFGRSGPGDEMLHIFGLDAANIVEKAKSAYRMK